MRKSAPPASNRLLKNAHLLRCATSFVTAAYVKVRLIPQALRALHLSIFEQPPKQGVLQHPVDPSRVGRPVSRFRLPQKFFVGCGGFTLLEVMIAMAILAITLVTVYQSQSQSISMASDSRFLTTASLLAQGRMAQIDAAYPSEVVSAKGDFGEEFSDYTWQVEVGDVKEIPLLKRIALTVTNGRMTTRNTYRLILYKAVLP